MRTIHSCKDEHVVLPHCSDCEEIDSRLTAVEECCEDAHEDINDLDEEMTSLDNTKASIEYVNESIGEVESDIENLETRLSNVIIENGVTENLWTGETGTKNELMNLSDGFNNYSFLDFYYNLYGVNVSQECVRIPASYLSNHTVYLQGTFHVGDQIYNDEISVVKVTNSQLKIADNEYWNWNGNNTQDASHNTTNSFGKLVRIDGIKAASSNTPSEVIDARTDANNVTHASLKARCDSDYTELKEDLSIATVNLNTKGVGRYKTDSNHAIVASNNNYIGMSGIVPIEANTDYIYTFFNTSIGTVYLTYYDSNKDFVSTINVSGNALQVAFKTPNNVAYIHIHTYKSGGIALNPNTHLQLEKGTNPVNVYLPPITANDAVARLWGGAAYNSLDSTIKVTEKDGYYNSDGSISTSHPNGEKYTDLIDVSLYDNITLLLEYSESKSTAWQYCTYDVNKAFIERFAYATTAQTIIQGITPASNVRYVALSYRTFNEQNVATIKGFANVANGWNILRQYSKTDENGIAGRASIGANPCRFKPLYDHLFVSRSGAYVTIPHESLYHVRFSRLFGFNVIEANIYKTSDDVYIVNHTALGTFGDYFHHVDGQTDISNILVSSVTWDWIVQNVRYNSQIAKYRTRPCRLEEFLTECRQQDIIPLVTSSDPNVVSIVSKYMGANNFIAYSATRKVCPYAIIYNWVTLSTKQEIIDYCENIGKPFIYGMSNPTSFTDVQLKEIVDELHSRGFWIGTSYKDENWYKYSALGFDFNGAIKQINRIDNGNICNLNTVYGFADFTYENATEANGVLTYTDDGALSPNVPEQNNGIYAIDIEIWFSGSITVPSKGEFTSPTTYSSDGSYPVFATIPIVDGTPDITLAVSNGTIVYDVKYKASKI